MGDDDTPETDTQAVGPPPEPAKARRSWWPAVVALVIGAAGGFGAGRLTAPGKTEIFAEQFCALGEGEGASLLDVAGWIKSVQRVHDLAEVRAEVSKRCDAWRRQVAERASELGDD